MAPTHGQEEIEGRYKEYAYSPVPASSTSAVYDSTTLAKYPVDIGAGSPKYRTYGVYEKCRVAEMTEKGSTLLQYVAAAAGKFQPFYCFASFRPVDRGLGSRAMRPVHDPRRPVHPLHNFRVTGRVWWTQRPRARPSFRLASFLFYRDAAVASRCSRSLNPIPEHGR